MNFNPVIFSSYQNLSYIDRIKLLMMCVMTIGHLAWAFVPTDTLLSEVLHFVARMTIPLACFLVVQGYHLSRDVWGYVRRLFGFGVLAQLPYAWFNYPIFGNDGLLANPYQVIEYGNVLFTVGFGLLTLITLNQINHACIPKKLCYLAPLCLFACLATWSDWGVLVIFWVSAIFYGGAWGFFWVSLALFGLSFLMQDNPNIAPYIFTLQTHSLMDYGVFLTVPIMLWYQNNKQNSPTHYRLPRLLFYWYYVIHLVVIGLLLAFVQWMS